MLLTGAWQLYLPRSLTASLLALPVLAKMPGDMKPLPEVFQPVLDVFGSFQADHRWGLLLDRSARCTALWSTRA